MLVIAATTVAQTPQTPAPAGGGRGQGRGGPPQPPRDPPAEFFSKNEPKGLVLLAWSPHVSRRTAPHRLRGRDGRGLTNRAKPERDPANPRHVLTVRGVEYEWASQPSPTLCHMASLYNAV